MKRDLRENIDIIWALGLGPLVLGNSLRSLHILEDGCGIVSEFPMTLCQPLEVYRKMFKFRDIPANATMCLLCLQCARERVKSSHEKSNPSSTPIDTNTILQE